MTQNKYAKNSGNERLSTHSYDLQPISEKKKSRNRAKETCRKPELKQRTKPQDEAQRVRQMTKT